jgi:hypothetical protein
MKDKELRKRVSSLEDGLRGVFVHYCERCKHFTLYWQPTYEERFQCLTCGCVKKQNWITECPDKSGAPPPEPERPLSPDSIKGLNNG